MTYNIVPAANLIVSVEFVPEFKGNWSEVGHYKKTITATILETPEYRVRKWLGTQLMRLAVMVWGCRVEFVDKANE